MRYTIERCRAVFTRRGYRVMIYDAPYSDFLNPVAMNFYGNDGRTVRADAVAWAKLRIGPRWRPMKIAGSAFR